MHSGHLVHIVIDKFFRHVGIYITSISQALLYRLHSLLTACAQHLLSILGHIIIEFFDVLIFDNRHTFKLATEVPPSQPRHAQLHIGIGVYSVKIRQGCLLKQQTPIHEDIHLVLHGPLFILLLTGGDSYLIGQASLLHQKGEIFRNNTHQLSLLHKGIGISSRMSCGHNPFSSCSHSRDIVQLAFAKN